MQLLPATRKRVVVKSLPPRGRGTALAVEGACETLKILLVLLCTHSPSVTASRASSLSEGAFGIYTSCAIFLFNFCSSAKPLLNHATIAWFSSYKKEGHPKKVPLSVLFISYRVRRKPRKHGNPRPHGPVRMRSRQRDGRSSPPQRCAWRRECGASSRA